MAVRLQSVRVEAGIKPCRTLPIYRKDKSTDCSAIDAELELKIQGGKTGHNCDDNTSTVTCLSCIHVGSYLTFENNVEKGKNADSSIFSFSHNVFHLSQNKFQLSTIFILSSANSLK